MKLVLQHFIQPKIGISVAVATMLFFLGSTPLHAQFELGIIGGGSVYGGDVGPDATRDYIRQMRLSYGAFARYRLSPYIAFKGHYQNLDLFGEDDLSRSETRQSRNIHFYTEVNELALQVELFPFKDSWPVSPYFIGGVAAYRFNPQAFYNGEFVPLQPLGTEGQGLPGFEEKYSLTRIAVPLGAGLRFNFGRGMFFGMQASGRATFFDHLDDVSGGAYVDETILAANGPLAVELAFRGDEVPGAEALTPPVGTPRGGAANDYYYSVSAHFSYQFGVKESGSFKSKRRKLSCPKF